MLKSMHPPNTGVVLLAVGFTQYSHVRRCTPVCSLRSAIPAAVRRCQESGKTSPETVAAAMFNAVLYGVNAPWKPQWAPKINKYY